MDVLRGKIENLLVLFSANPTLEFSGFEGENKKEMYEQLPSHYYPKTVFVNAKQDLQNVIELVSENTFHYPFVAKTTGWNAWDDV
jgi:hypothetical protein